jgi:hypothetical protein
LLLHRSRGKRAAGNIELIPANSRWTDAILVDTNGLRSPQRFRPTAILVSDRRHNFIAQGIQLLRGSLLGHEVSSSVREGVNEPVDCDLGVRQVVWANAESRIIRVGKIDMKQPAMDLG